MIWDMKFWEYLFPLHLSKENSYIFSSKKQGWHRLCEKQNITENIQFKYKSNWEKEIFWASDMIKENEIYCLFFLEYY